MPSKRLSRKLSVAHDVATVAGVPAGVDPEGWFPAAPTPRGSAATVEGTRQRLQTRPLSLVRSNRKPFASYVVVVVVVLYLS